MALIDVAFLFPFNNTIAMQEHEQCNINQGEARAQTKGHPQSLSQVVVLGMVLAWFILILHDPYIPICPLLQPSGPHKRV